MKPHPFDYVRADTVEEAVALLAEYGDDARVLAGGQSLVAMLNLRLVEPAVLIDITRIAELADIREADGKVEVGAAVTQNRLMAWPSLAVRFVTVIAAKEVPAGRQWQHDGSPLIRIADRCDPYCGSI